MKFKKYSTATDIYTTFPATFQTSVADVENYQVYGETVENLFTTDNSQTGYLKSDGTIVSPHDNLRYTDYLPISNTGNVTFTFTPSYAQEFMQNPAICFYDESKTFIEGFSFDSEPPPIVKTVPSGSHYCRVSYRITYTDIMLTKGSTAPTRYVPYGTPDGVGEETENLFDISEYTIGTTTFPTKMLTLEPNTAYTMSSDVPTYNNGALIMLMAIGDSASTPNNGVYSGHPITKTTDANGKIYVGLRDNGSGYDLSTYKTMLVKGSTSPTTYIPFGYKIPILNTSGVTENLFDKDATDTNNGYVNRCYIKSDGTLTTPGYSWIVSEYMPIESNANYTIGIMPRGAAGIYNAFYDVNKELISTFENINAEANTFTTPANATYIRLSIRTFESETDIYMFVKGNTLPDHYIPHRYTSNYDLFIGDSKLGEDEYLDYQEQKVYKRTEQLLPPYNMDSGASQKGKYISAAGIISTSSNINNYVCGYINVLPSTAYALKDFSGNTTAICYYDSNKNYISGEAYNNRGSFIVTTPANCYYVRMTAKAVDTSNNVFIEGNEIPENYIPYLTPTDPPLPFPALTTYIGENNLSVDTTVQPEKVAVTVAAWREIEAKKYVNGSWTDIVVRRYENGAWVPSPIPENNIADLQGLLTLLEDHWLPGVNDYRSMILVRTNRNDDTANQLCYMLTCYSPNPSPHFESEFLNNRYWLNDYSVPYSSTDFYLRKFSWSQGGGWVYDGYEDNKRDDYFVPIDSNTYNVYLLRIGSSTQYDNNAGYQYFYDLSAYF